MQNFPYFYNIVTNTSSYNITNAVTNSCITNITNTVTSIKKNSLNLLNTNVLYCYYFVKHKVVFIQKINLLVLSVFLLLWLPP